MKLPTYEECREAVSCGEPTPLDIFIYEHEPSDSVSEQVFRDQLQALVDYVAKDASAIADQILAKALVDQKDAERYMHMKLAIIGGASWTLRDRTGDQLDQMMDDAIRSYDE